MQTTFRILDLSARLLLALGMGCLLLAVYLAWQSLSFQRDTARAIGEVVSYREIPDDKGTRFAPRVRYRTEDGAIVTIDGQFAGTSKRFTIGEKVPMVYKVTTPSDARIDLFTDNWLETVIAMVIGLVGFAGGILVRRSVRREIAKTRP